MFFLLRRIKNQASKASATPAKVAPTAIPAVAPVERPPPPDEELDPELEVSAGADDPVVVVLGVGVDKEVKGSPTVKKTVLE